MPSSAVVPDRAPEERRVLPRRGAPGRHGGPGLLRHFPVGREMVLAADAIVVNPRRMRPRRIDFRWQLRHCAHPRFATKAYRHAYLAEVDQIYAAQRGNTRAATPAGNASNAWAEALPSLRVFR